MISLSFSLVQISLAAQVSPQVSPDGFDPAEVSKKAEAAMNAQKFSEAARLFRRLDEHYPDIPGLKINLGMALYFDGESKEALSFLTRATEMDPSLENGWFFAGMASMELGLADQAVAHLAEYLKRKPIDYDARQIYADALSNLKRHEEAITEYQKVLRGQPENPKAWYGIGTSFEALATRYFDKLDEIAPESGYWLALVADSRVVQKQFASAYFLYRQALEDVPDLRGVHFSISRIYRENGNDEWAAIEEQRESALGVPDCEEEELVCSFLKGDFSRVVSEGDTSKPADLYWMIQSYNQLAVAAFSELNQLPSSYEAHVLRAQVEDNLGRYWESVKQWKKALEYEPGDPFARRQLAVSLYFNRNYEESNKIVHELLEKDPNAPRLNFMAGDILVYQQQLEKAVPYLEKAVNFDESYIAAHSSLGRAYMSLGKAEEAVPHLEKALPTDEDGSIHYQLALAYQRSGQTDKAREMMTTYQEMRSALEEENRQLTEEVKITPPTE